MCMYVYVCMCMYVCVCIALLPATVIVQQQTIINSVESESLDLGKYDCHAENYHFPFFSC